MAPGSWRVGLSVPDVLRLAGMQEILRENPAYVVCGLGAPTLAEITALDLLVLDETGTEHLLPLLGALARARPQLPVLVIGPESGEPHIESVIGAGARGYLTHQARAAELKAAVEVVLDGSIWAPRRVLARLLEEARREAAGHTAGGRTVRLSKREVQVLDHLIEGRSNREIAAVLGLDEGTIKSHLSRMMRKAGVTNRTALSMTAMREGWAHK